ncbi:MAG TPA: hypothetical protein VM536_03735 [Chloroflexia bacterium]|nr:hypothetical protein [Chloroflexia bacterium]
MRDYLETFFRRKWLFWVPFLAVLLVAVAGGVYTSWLYEVQARMAIRANADLSGTTAAGSDLQAEYGRLSDLLLTNDFMQRVVNAVPALKGAADTPQKMDAQVDSLRKDLNAWKPGQDLINFRYRARDPQVAQQVVSKTIDLFIAQRYDDRVTEADKGIQFWTDQQTTYTQRLEVASKALSDWEGAHPASTRATLPETQQLEFQRLKTAYDAALENVKTATAKMGDAEMHKAQALAQQANTYQIVDAPRVPQSPALSLNRLLGLVLVGLAVALGLGISVVALATWFGGARRAPAGAATTALPVWLQRMMVEEEQTA